MARSPRQRRRRNSFYTLYRSDATRTIFDSLGIPRQRSSQVRGD